MPKLTFFILFSLLFSLSSSFATSPDNNNDNNNDDNDVVTLLLPSQTRQQQNPEQISTVGFSEIFPQQINGPKSSENSHDRPMRIVRLHPINRHFPAAGARLGSLRIPPHGCRHHKVNGKHISRFSFGDDMMVVSGENGDFDPMVHVEVPKRMVRIHRHHHHRGFPMGKKHDFFANHRFREERDWERDEERDGEREERQDGSFMKSVRKFLNGRF